MERCSNFLDWKNQYCKNGQTTHSNLQIHCNPDQITHDIFHRTRTNNPNIYVEPQKTQNCQSQFRGTKTKQEASLSQTAGNTTKPQSSRQCGTGTKTDRQTDGTE